MGVLSDDTQSTKLMVMAFKPASAKVLTGDADSIGNMHIPGMGGVGILRDSIYPYRYGHIKFPARDRTHANLMRQMKLSVWVRQDDPTPLSLAAGFSNGYQGARLTKEEQDRRRSNMTRTAIADHKRKGDQKSKMVMLLAVVAAISVVVACLIWLSIPIIGALG